MGRGGFVSGPMNESYLKTNEDYDVYVNRHGLVSY